MVGDCGIKAPGLAGLGVCGSTAIIVFALNDGNLGVIVVHRAIVFVGK